MYSQLFKKMVEENKHSRADSRRKTVDMQQFLKIKKGIEDKYDS